jgi:hypothetical protein
MEKDVKAEVAELLKRFKEGEVFFDDHARMQSAIRGIDREEVVQNLLNPSKMFFAREQEARGENERKFDCYFGVSKRWAHRYVIVINGRLLVITVIKVRKKWQKKVDTHAKI